MKEKVTALSYQQRLGICSKRKSAIKGSSSKGFRREPEESPRVIFENPLRCLIGSLGAYFASALAYEDKNSPLKLPDREILIKNPNLS